MPTDTLPDWERLLISMAAAQIALSESVLTELRDRFDQVLAELESVAGLKSADMQCPVQIVGSLDGIDTGVRQLIREEPLATTEVEAHGQRITVPTQAEILRIKGVLILRRNAMRDYIDFAALADSMGESLVAEALQAFDRLYPQPYGQSALLQLQIHLANPIPFDLGDLNLEKYKHLASMWSDWNSVKEACANTAIAIFDRLSEASRSANPCREHGSGLSG